MSGGDRKIYQRKEYIIIATKTGYVVYNTKKQFTEGHTHLKSYKMATTLIDNCINRKKPTSTNPYIITSHIRVSKDEKYIKMLEELLETKKGKTKKTYVNQGGRKR